MESLRRDQTLRTAHLKKTVDDTQKVIDLLLAARENLATAPAKQAAVLANLQTPVKQALSTVHADIKDIYSDLNNYGKTLDKTFKDKPLALSGEEVMASQTDLVNRAIAMHLLREGQFDVATTFLRESGTEAQLSRIPIDPTNNSQDIAMSDQDPKPSSLDSESLRVQFGHMYHMLDEMRTRRNLAPAMEWARAHRTALEDRGSNLEFELTRLQFIWLFLHHTSSHPPSTSSTDTRIGEDTPMPVSNDSNLTLGARQRAALEYARSAFRPFQDRYLREIQQLVGAMAFSNNLARSPYRHLFHDESAWEELARSFAREFCGHLGLAADSPVYLATTAGAIALPTLQKLQAIMATKRTEWTSDNELPVEIPLPRAYRFHSIFVCPVSKGQTTEDNPPMMLPCYHVVSRETLDNMGRNIRFKCPYCPHETTHRECRRVYL